LFHLSNKYLAILLNHHTPRQVFLRELIRAFNTHLELKNEIAEKIKNTRGGEQLSWIKKYNGLFIKPWN